MAAAGYGPGSVSGKNEKIYFFKFSTIFKNIEKVYWGNTIILFSIRRYQSSGIKNGRCYLTKESICKKDDMRKKGQTTMHVYSKTGMKSIANLRLFNMCVVCFTALYSRSPIKRPASVAQRAERRTRDREVPVVPLPNSPVPSGFSLRQGN